MEVEVNGSNEYPALYKVMMEKLNEQRQLDQFTDITLIVDGKNIIGHFDNLDLLSHKYPIQSDRTLCRLSPPTLLVQCPFERI